MLLLQRKEGRRLWLAPGDFLKVKAENISVVLVKFVVDWVQYSFYSNTYFLQTYNKGEDVTCWLDSFDCDCFWRVRRVKNKEKKQKERRAKHTHTKK